MSGPAIQSTVPFSPAAPFSAPPQRGEALPAQTAAAPLPVNPPVNPVELEFSELGRILEKLALMTGSEVKELGQLINTLRSQGQMPGVLQLMNMAQRAEPGNSPLQPDILRALALQLLGQADATETGKASSPSASALQEFQGKVTQSLQTLTAALKAALTPPLDRPELLGLPAAPGRAAPDAGGATPQWIPAQIEQAAGAIKQFAARLPAMIQPGGLAGAPEAALTTAFEGLQGSPTGANNAETAAVDRLAAALSQLQRTGKPGENPLVRSEYIKATIGLVAALLGDPAQTPSGRGTGSAAPIAPARAAAGQEVQSAQAEDSKGLIQGLIKEIGSVKGLLTVPGGKAWATIEKTLVSLSQAATGSPPNGNPGATKIPPERMGELVRRGLLFELEFKTNPKLEETAAALRRLGIQAEVAGKGPSTGARLRITVPGKDPQAAPLRLIPPGSPETARAAQPAAHDRSGQGAPAAQSEVQTAPLPRGEAAREGVAASTLGRASEREAASTAPRDAAASSLRPDQYSHPEAFRLPPHARHAMAGLTAFFQAHREEALLGLKFDDSAPEGAPGARRRGPITDPRRLLEYKPIEVIRPEKTKAGAAGDQKPRFGFAGQSRQDPVEKIVDIKPVAVGRR